jgi:hypothetical protein
MMLVKYTYSVVTLYRFVHELAKGFIIFTLRSHVCCVLNDHSDSCVRASRPGSSLVTRCLVQHTRDPVNASADTDGLTTVLRAYFSNPADHTTAVVSRKPHSSRCALRIYSRFELHKRIFERGTTRTSVVASTRISPTPLEHCARFEVVHPFQGA